jgi:hypothetical protein
VDRLLYKENIIDKAATYLGLSIKFLMAKRLYRDELEKPVKDKKLIDKKKLFLKDTVYERLTYKKNLRRYIQ